MLQAECPYCYKSLTFANSAAGQAMACIHCGGEFLVNLETPTKAPPIATAPQVASRGATNTKAAKRPMTLKRILRAAKGVGSSNAAPMPPTTVEERSFRELQRINDKLGCMHAIMVIWAILTALALMIALGRK